MISEAFGTPIWLLPIAASPLWIFLLLRTCHRSVICRVRASVRAVVLLLLMLVLSQPTFLTHSSDPHTVFVIDRSESMPRSDSLPENLELLIRDAAAHGGASIVSFAEDTVVEYSSIQPNTAVSLQGELEDSHTNIEKALNQALALIPAGVPGRIVLFSDGQQSRGDVLQALPHVQAQSVPLTVLLREDTRRDAGILAVSAPSEVRRGETHRLNIELVSSHSFEGTLQFYRNDEYLGSSPARVETGHNYFSYVQRAEKPGVHTYEVFLSGSDDLRPQNDYGRTSIFVPRKSSLLYVTEDAKASRMPVEVLELQGFNVELRRPDQIPGDVSEYSIWDAVLFDNVPAAALTYDTMLALDRYVRILGGGFVMLGSDQSFGPGGYYKTPVERMLPVDMDISSSMSTPALTMILIMDKSGSMGNPSLGTAEKLDILKQSALSAIQVMNPYYSVGVLSFDADAQWIVPVRKVSRRQSIMEDLARISPGGGTDLEVALREALRVLRSDPAKVRHILVLSDGLVKPSDYERLIGEIAEEEISVSSVAIGKDSNRSFMESLAVGGGGRFYAADSIEEAPQIFITEARMVSRSLISEEPYFPLIADQHPVLQGIAPQLPPLRGGVLTYTKDEARQIITGIDEYPLLSVRQYGLGRSAAFTADLSGKWSGQLLSHEDFPRLWGQLLRWCAAPQEDSRLFVQLEPQSDNTAALQCELREPDGTFINNAVLKLAVLYPDRKDLFTDLPQTAPGRYSAAVPLSDSGDTLITVSANSEQVPLARHTRVLHRPYSEEFSILHSQEESSRMMGTLAKQSGGRLITYSRSTALYPEDLFPKASSAADALQNSPQWRPLVLIALLLFAIECAGGIIWAHRDSLHREYALFFRHIPGAKDTSPHPSTSALSQIEQQKSAEKRRDFSFWFGRGYNERSE